MLTYDFDNADGPIYLYIYRCIKNDILSGVLAPGEKLPSKRTFASNNGISTITIQNAYDQLISEGYVETKPKRGYFVANIEGMPKTVAVTEVKHDIKMPVEKGYKYDFVSNGIDADNFPFSVWSKVSRAVMADKKDELMTIAPTSGVRELREAIATHLKSFRGMLVDPDQIIVGAGTEYLYGMIVELLGRDKLYAIENPGYKKLVNIYKQHGIDCRYASMDDNGVTTSELNRVKANVAHICPNHHFPTGITMPASRRYEVLAWASAQQDRYIIEDDYDSEFRTVGRPIPPLYSIDGLEKVIYMNTFSKSLSPTIRVSYMVLPPHLANEFYKKMSFYSCTVSNFEQYTLAQFISQGYFEKHINRMRLFYSRKRSRVMEIINKSDLSKKCEIIENDAGLHFLIHLMSDKKDSDIEEYLENKGIGIKALSDYYFTAKGVKEHFLVFNYSNLDEDSLIEALQAVEL